MNEKKERNALPMNSQFGVETKEWKRTIVKKDACWRRPCFIVSSSQMSERKEKRTKPTKEHETRQIVWKSTLSHLYNGLVDGGVRWFLTTLSNRKWREKRLDLTFSRLQCRVDPESVCDPRACVSPLVSWITGAFPSRLLLNRVSSSILE